MKTVGTIIFGIWFGVAAIMAIYYTLEDKAECVKTDGVIKGLVWCESSAKTHFGRSTDHTSKFIEGALWPLKLFQNITASSTKTSQSHYLCRDMLYDVRYARENADAMKRLLAKMSNGIFKEDDNAEMRHFYESAVAYYGRKPSNEELNKFSFESMKAGAEVCKKNGNMSVKEAAIRGADLLARKGKYHTFDR